MALSDILQKITADYNERAQKIIDTAMADAENFQRQVKEDEMKKNELRWKQAVDHKNDAIKKARTKSDLFSDQKVLATKHQLIDEVFNLAQEKMQKIPSVDYVDFLSSMITRIDVEKGEIISAKKHLDDTKKAVNKAKKSFSVQEGDFDGGLIFRADDNDIEINATFDRLFANLKQKYESEIAKILFS